MSSEFDAAVNLLASGNSFLIAGHVNPDGDTLGCMCAMGLALRKIGKFATLVCADPVPQVYRFIPAADTILREIPEKPFNTAIIVDCDGLDRTGPLAERIRTFERFLEIDHHQGKGSGFGVKLIDPSAAAAGELVFELLKRARIEMDAQIAECLLTAVVTDTGSFKFANVTPNTLRIASELVSAGASPVTITRNVYESRTFAGTRLLGLMLSALTTVDGGRIVYSSITRDMLAETGASDDDTEGFVNYIRSVRGAVVGVLFRESEDGASVRASLRAGNGIDVSQVARKFGGGGHKAAAGCTIEKPLAEAIQLVLNVIKELGQEE
jgi:phosphoesterase RecJ-like protein